MPLEPPAAGSIYATARAASKAWRKSDSLPIAGSGAPCFTATPMATRASRTDEPRATRPACSSSSIAAGVNTTTSKASPLPMRRASAPAVSFSMRTVCPV
ncbi:MAG: hypothetical protein BWX79_03378 [Alphaproteobacteria bacterium ADurb.Bin100]|nr:MAG: hypothetical protein BWX79_03378 [Alphaproteobacteria bacterium ADurb.Bin100]